MDHKSYHWYQIGQPSQGWGRFPRLGAIIPWSISGETDRSIAPEIMVVGRRSIRHPLWDPTHFRTAFAVRFREGTTSVKWLRLARCITRSSEGRGAADPESIFCFWGDRTVLVQQKKTNCFELMVLTQKIQCHCYKDIHLEEVRARRFFEWTVSQRSGLRSVN